MICSKHLERIAFITDKNQLHKGYEKNRYITDLKN